MGLLSPSTPATRSDAHAWLHFWQATLGLSALDSRIEVVLPLQVTGENGLPGAELVGVVVEELGFSIVHTRPLSEADVIHELLHVDFPDWDHEAIEIWTNLLALGISNVSELFEYAATHQTGGKLWQPNTKPSISGPGTPAPSTIPKS